MAIAEWFEESASSAKVRSTPTFSTQLGSLPGLPHTQSQAFQLRRNSQDKTHHCGTVSGPLPAEFARLRQAYQPGRPLQPLPRGIWDADMVRHRARTKVSWLCFPFTFRPISGMLPTVVGDGKNSENCMIARVSANIQSCQETTS